MRPASRAPQLHDISGDPVHGERRMVRAIHIRPEAAKGLVQGDWAGEKSGFKSLEFFF